MEKAQGKGHECPPSFRELPRSVAICEPYYFLSHAIFVWIVRVVYFCARPFMTQTASEIIFHRTMQTLKTILFLLLAAFMIYAGVSHLTFHRLDFVAEVPMWLRFSDGFTDFVVLASGVVEIVLGLSMLLLWRHKAKIGALLALFFVLVFPGNLNQLSTTSTHLV